MGATGASKGGVFKRIGGDIALDFANTADWHARPAYDELLRDYGRLLDWGRQAGTLTPGQEADLRAAAAARPAEADAALAEAIGIRDAIYRLFSALAAGRPLPGADLDRLNAALAATLPHLRLDTPGDTPAWAWVGDPAALDRPIWAAIRAAADLLTSTQRELVCECAADGCGWLFLDTSRNRSRRWCESRSCGNRSRVQRHYWREKASGDRR